MKPSEQLSEEQRKRVAYIASMYWGGPNPIETAIYKVLDELVPEMAKDSQRLSYLIEHYGSDIFTFLWDGGNRIPLNDVRSAIDTAISQER